MKPNHCAIVSDEGPDALGRSLDEIVPYGTCALWEQFAIFTIGRMHWGLAPTAFTNLKSVSILFSSKDFLVDLFL
jgi:hypothetical protein